MEKPIKKNNSGLKSTFIGIGIFLFIIQGAFIKPPYTDIVGYIIMMIVFLIVGLSYRKKSMLFQSKVCLCTSVLAIFCIIYELIKLLR